MSKREAVLAGVVARARTRPGPSLHARVHRRSSPKGRVVGGAPPAAALNAVKSSLLGAAARARPSLRGLAR